MRALTQPVHAVAAACILLAAFSPRPWQIEFSEQILDVHNAERQAVGAPPLAWSEALMAEAAGWAANLAREGALRHSGNADRPGQGENLWMGTRDAFTPAQMAQGWADEKALFRYGVFPDVSASGDWTDVGHYTQMIWAETQTVGCALASSAEWDVLVCRYGPPGNVRGRPPY